MSRQMDRRSQMDVLSWCLRRRPALQSQWVVHIRDGVSRLRKSVRVILYTLICSTCIIGGFTCQACVACTHSFVPTSTRSVLPESSFQRNSSVPVKSVCAAKKSAPSKTVRKIGEDPDIPARRSSTLRVPLLVPSVRQSSAPARL